MRNIKSVYIFVLFGLPFTIAHAQSADSISVEQNTSGYNGEVTPEQTADNVAPNLNAKKKIVAPGYSSSTGRTKFPEYEFQSFDPRLYTRSIGYEGGYSNYGPFSQQMVVYSRWSRPDFGWETFAGFSKAKDSFSENNSTSSNPVSQTNTESQTYSGVENPLSISLGGGARWKLYHNRWMMIYWGTFGNVVWTDEVKYKVGSTSTTINDTSDPNDYTVTENGFGKVKKETDVAFNLGGKIGSEFYIKWFPQLALGFSAGLLAGFGGDTTTKTETVTQSYAVVNGSKQSPTSKTISSSKDETERRYGADTFGTSGGLFSFTGNFTLRYIW